MFFALQEDLAPLIDAARALQIKGLADTPSSNSGQQAPPQTGGGLNGKQPKLPNQPLQPVQPPPMKRARPPGGGGGMNLMNHHNRRKAESPKQILQHPHAAAAAAAAAMAAALPNSFLPTQPLPMAAASPLSLQQHQQVLILWIEADRSCFFSFKIIFKGCRKFQGLLEHHEFYLNWLHRSKSTG